MSELQKNNRTYGKTVKKKIPDTSVMASPKEDLSQKYTSITKRSKLQTISDKIANDKLVYLNWYYPGGKEEFPQHDNLRRVDKMYPYAEGGKLLIDEPRFPWEIERCETKRQVLNKLGFRYIAILPQMTLEEAVAELNK